jgi:hypothetical protein
MVEKSIQELESQIKILNNTISNLKDIGGDLEEQIKNSQDIEKSYSDKFEIQDKIDIKDILENEA